jgi:hypothetical protein
MVSIKVIASRIGWAPIRVLPSPHLGVLDQGRFEVPAPNEQMEDLWAAGGSASKKKANLWDISYFAIPIIDQ